MDVPWKNHSITGIFFMNGSTSRSNTGATTSSPQRPITTLGTAAMRSTSTPKGRSHRGASSVR